MGGCIEAKYESNSPAQATGSERHNLVCPRAREEQDGGSAKKDANSKRHDLGPQRYFHFILEASMEKSWAVGAISTRLGWQCKPVMTTAVKAHAMRSAVQLTGLRDREKGADWLRLMIAAIKIDYTVLTTVGRRWAADSGAKLQRLCSKAAGNSTHGGRSLVAVKCEWLQ
jgi:hypothetical protein